MADQNATSTFTSALRTFVGTCSAISVGCSDERTGLLITSGTSVSIDPPTLLLCVNKSASAHPFFKKDEAFGWSVLGKNHRKLAEQFAGFGGTKGKDRYQGEEWRVGASGVQILKNAPVAFECSIDDVLERETHSIVIGLVTKIHTNDSQGLLAYRNGQFEPLN